MLFNISFHVWLWLINAAIVVILSAWAIIDGLRDIKAIKQQISYNVRARDMNVIARRHIRTGILSFMLGNMAGSVGTIYVISQVNPGEFWTRLFGVVFVYVLNGILGLVSITLLWDRYDRYILLHDGANPFTAWKEVFIRKVKSVLRLRS